MKRNETGVRRVVWVPNDMDRIVENARKKIGMNRSAFYKYAIARLLEELNIFTATVHLEERPALQAVEART